MSCRLALISKTFGNNFFTLMFLSTIQIFNCSSLSSFSNEEYIILRQQFGEYYNICLPMRLLSHNILVCNVLKCTNNNLPFIIQVDRSEYRESEFNREHIVKLIKKLEWSSLYKTVTALGEKNFSKELTNEMVENEEFLRKLHRIILDTHIMEGRLICPSCNREYPIVNGIPNMILNESEM